MLLHRADPTAATLLLHSREKRKRRGALAWRLLLVRSERVDGRAEALAITREQ
jgi:hypothetical protein